MKESHLTLLKSISLAICLAVIISIVPTLARADGWWHVDYNCCCMDCQTGFGCQFAEEIPPQNQCNDDNQCGVAFQCCILGCWKEWIETK